MPKNVIQKFFGICQKENHADKAAWLAVERQSY
jgi:hypothetical protein